MPVKISRTWKNEDLVHVRDDQLTPIKPIWGMSVNGICNPRLDAVFAEFAKAINAIEAKMEPTPVPTQPTLRQRLGTFISRIGDAVAGKGGGNATS